MRPRVRAVRSRRQFLQTAGSTLATATFAATVPPSVHVLGSDLIQLALVGCGGRGSGAVVDALSTASGPIKLVAMADAFEDRLKSSYAGLHGSEVGRLIDVPEDRRFVGFDAYRKAMDCLKPGDVAIFATPAAFRWVHFGYAVQKNLNVFMEKSVTVDGPSTRRMLQLANEARAKNLKCGVGLMCRHARPLQELHQRILDGQLGEIILMRGYRMHGPAGQVGPKPQGMSELEFQVRRFHSFLWAGGGFFTDWCIHHIDHLSWMKNAWPVKAQAVGGKHYKTLPDGSPSVDQNLDTYAVEYSFGDGTKYYHDARCIAGAAGMYASFIHGTGGFAVASRANDCGAPSAIYRARYADPSKLRWESTDISNPYRNEWEDLIAAIRSDRPYDEVTRGAEASLVAHMGRMAAHTGQEITFRDMLNCDHEMAPGLERLTNQSPAPVRPDSAGRYPVPQPGITVRREY